MMELNLKKGDTFIKDGYEYVILATRQDPAYYVIAEGKDFVASRSFTVEVIAFSENDLKDITIQRNS